MRIDVITIFPALFGQFLDHSIVARARERGIIDVAVHDLRDYTTDRHRTVDDAPYGGGPGMVMKPEPWFAALRDIAGEAELDDGQREIVLLSPRGEQLTQKIFEDLKDRDRMVLLCGRYEDVDDRVRKTWVTREISLGDYVINGGELAAQVMIEGIARLLPGAIGDPESAEQDSYSSGLLDHRHFTRPPEFEGMAVPDVLLSGDHEAIRRWRLKDSLETTQRRRPDLLKQKDLTKEERSILAKIASADTGNDSSS